jgi:hypothetical protein
LQRRAESAALEDMGDGLELTARALERDDEKLAEQALSNMRDLRDRLAEVSRMRRASSRVVRHSLAWRMRWRRWCASVRTPVTLTSSAAAA